MAAAAAAVVSSMKCVMLGDYDNLAERPQVRVFAVRRLLNATTGLLLNQQVPLGPDVL
jgi:hypothetical protein